MLEIILVYVVGEKVRFPVRMDATRRSFSQAWDKFLVETDGKCRFDYFEDKDIKFCDGKYAYPVVIGVVADEEMYSFLEAKAENCGFRILRCGVV
jgi:hypothetical protein